MSSHELQKEGSKLDAPLPEKVETKASRLANRVARTWWILLPTLCAAATVWFATSIRLGVSLDSVIYLDAAHRLAANFDYSAFQHGVVKPLSHYPPMLPVVIAAIPGDRLTAARWLNILLFASLVGSSVWIVRQISGRVDVALVAGILVIVARDLLGAYVVLASEPLYLILQIAFFCVLARYIHTENPRYLAFATLAAGWAPLVRFPGVVLIATGLGVLLSFDRSQQRLRRAAWFTALASMPLAVWLAWRRATAGTATNRELAFHPLWRDVAQGATRTVSGWVLPDGPSSFVLRLVVSLAIAGLVVAAIKNKWRDAGFGGGYVRVTTIFLVVYSAFLTAAITFVDAQSSTTPRFLVPMLVAVIPVVAGTTWRVQRLALLVLALYLARGTLGYVTWLHSHGTGYTALRWQRIRLQQLVGFIPGPIYSNVPEAIYYLTGNLSQEVPAPINRWSRKPNPAYPQQFSAMRAAIDQEQGAVIYFNFIPRRAIPGADSVAHWLGVTPVEWRSQTLVISHIQKLRKGRDERE